MELPPRFASKFSVDAATGCWVWTACRLANGYGQYRLNTHLAVLVHRYAYELLVGPIPAGLEIDHLCKNRACCNPAHLEPVTRLENIRRSDHFDFGWLRNKTHCKRGHPFDEANTSHPSDGSRQCRTCIRMRAAERRARKAA